MKTRGVLLAFFTACFLLSGTAFADGDGHRDRGRNRASAPASSAEAQAKAQQFQGQNQQQSLFNKVDVSGAFWNEVEARFGNEFNPEVTATGGTGIGIGGDGGEVNVEEGALSPSATATVEEGAVQSESNAEATGIEGDVNSANTQSVNITQTYEQLPGVAGVQTPETAYTQLYDLSKITAEKGINFGLVYEEICRPSTTALSPEPVEDDVNDIQFQFVPHQQYLSSDEGRVRVHPHSDIPEDGITAKCLGILQAEDISDKNRMYPFVADQARRFGVRHFRNYEDVYLVTMLDIISANRGVSNESGAWNLLPGLSRVLSGGDNVGSLGGGLARNNGQAFTGVRLGTTYMVFAEDPSGFRLTMGSFEPEPEPKPEEEQSKPVIEEIDPPDIQPKRERREPQQAACKPCRPDQPEFTGRPEFE